MCAGVILGGKPSRIAPLYTKYWYEYAPGRYFPGTWYVVPTVVRLTLLLYTVRCESTSGTIINHRHEQGEAWGTGRREGLPLFDA